MHLLPGTALARPVSVGSRQNHVEHQPEITDEPNHANKGNESQGQNCLLEEPKVQSGEFGPPFTPGWLAAEGQPRLANTWQRYGPKAGRDIRAVGDLRHCLYLAIEGTPEIVEVCEEPFRFRVQVSDVWVTCAYDLWCRTSDGEDYYFDAFYLKRLKTAEPDSPFWRQLRARELWAAQHSLRYAICTEKLLLRYPHEIANWSSILSYLSAARNSPKDDLGCRIRRCVEARGTARLREIEAQFPDIEVELVRTAAFSEVHAGRMSAELRSVSLSKNTIFKNIP